MNITKRLSILLWTLQALLAALFAFAGVMKLTLPAAAMPGPVPLELLRFIAVAELLGAVGLILPGLLRVRTELTSLAAAGLTVIMLGATVITVATDGASGALVPAVVCALTAFVARSRRQPPTPRATAAALRAHGA